MNYIKKHSEYFCIVLFSVLLFPAVLKYGSAFFTDLRFQRIIQADGYSVPMVAVTLGISLLLPAAAWEFLRRNKISAADFFKANLPLAGLGIQYFLPPSFPLLIIFLILLSLCAGRTAALCKDVTLPDFGQKRTLGFLGLIVVLYAAFGAIQQYHSLNTLAMSWFDWGHFFECLYNFFRGKPFHLNLNGGSFLGSRFTPTLTLLLPVVAAGNPFLFFFAGSLLVCSGAIFVFLIAKSGKASNSESFLWGVWYLLIPGITNMNLPLIDGPHEVFLLFPLMTAAFYCAVNKKIIPAVILTLLALGVRETVGIISAGYGILLFINRKRKAGVLLFVFSLLYVIVTLKVLMPLFDPPVKGTYAHVGFYSHLGKNITEIALSPLLKADVFFSSLFNSHNLLFWCMLLLPFAAAAGNALLFLLPMLPEFIMVSVDRRFDTQTVLRHYQASILIVLIIAALWGLKKMREGNCRFPYKYLFSGLNAPDLCRGVSGFCMAAAFFSFFVFTQFPGLSATDPQRRSSGHGNVTAWEDARPALERIKKLLPENAKVTAGPRLASMLIPRNDIYFNFAPDEKTLQDYVLIENFFSFYFPEDALSHYLIQSPNWELLHQEFVDERSIQLFKRSAVPLKKVPPVHKIPQMVWEKAGQLIPLPLTDLEIRAAQTAHNTLRFGVRIKQKRRNDAGFRIHLNFADGTDMKFFTSFCNGRYPADLAKAGDTFFFAVNFPAGKQITGCRVNVVELKSSVAPQ